MTSFNFTSVITSTSHCQKELNWRVSAITPQTVFTNWGLSPHLSPICAGMHFWFDAIYDDDYCIYSCISRPPFSRSKIEFLIISGKTNEIHTNKNFPKHQSFLPENVLKTRWIKKSRGLIICSEVYQDHNVRTYELFDLLEKYFTIFGSKSPCI